MTPIEQRRVYETKILIGGNTDAIPDDTVAMYLRLAERKILKRLYPFDPASGVMPDEYVLDMEELASRMVIRRGAEGEIQHSENGVSRTYDSVDDEDILGRIIPFIKIIE